MFVVGNHLTNWCEEKAGTFSTLFALVSYDTDRAWAALSSDLEDCFCGNSGFLFVYMEIVRDQLNVCRSMRWDSSQSTQGTGGCCHMTSLNPCQRFWESGKGPCLLEAIQHYTSLQEGHEARPKKHRPASLAPVPGKL